MNKIDWDYYDKFEEINKKYLPDIGEGETRASQIVTAINKLIYKWYNDGDVFDNTCNLLGWCNDLSSYANWLSRYVEGATAILDNVFDANEDEYENLLKDLADEYLTEEFLSKNAELPKAGSIYECDGIYKFVEYQEEPEEDEFEDDEEYEEEW